jgi:DNA invertase Pin-like site-specific DNA recombinase
VRWRLLLPSPTVGVFCPTGKLMEGVLAAFAQFDNDCRSDRTRAGMKAALELGRWTFLAPIGYVRGQRPALWSASLAFTSDVRPT